MPKGNSNLNSEIDAEKFFLGIFWFFFIAGTVTFFVWFYKNIYKPEEKAYINASRYAYNIFHKEILNLKDKDYFKQDDNEFNDTEFCFDIARKYSKKKSGSCTNFNPGIPVENFIFKDKKISVLGLEKPAFNFGGSLVKDIVIDYNSEKKGNNQVGTDRAILRLYLSGANAGLITPVNCDKKDEEEFELKTSLYCIGSTGQDFLNMNIPLGYDIIQTNVETGVKHKIGKNLPLLRADCTALDGDIMGAEDFCSMKMFYMLKGCEDEYTCEIVLAEY